jgi:hypothetical protein
MNWELMSSWTRPWFTKYNKRDPTVASEVAVSGFSIWCFIQRISTFPRNTCSSRLTSRLSERNSATSDEGIVNFWPGFHCTVLGGFIQSDRLRYDIATSYRPRHHESHHTSCCPRRPARSDICTTMVSEGTFPLKNSAFSLIRVWKTQIIRKISHTKAKCTMCYFFL